MLCPNGTEGCDPRSQHPCWPCKVQHWRSSGHIPGKHLPRYFTEANATGVTQRELAREIFETAKATGRDLQKA